VLAVPLFSHTLRSIVRLKLLFQLRLPCIEKPKATIGAMTKIAPGKRGEWTRRNFNPVQLSPVWQLEYESIHIG